MIAVTFDEALSRARLRPFQWATFAVCMLVLVVDGIDLQLLGPVVPVIIEDWGVGRGSFGSAMSAALIGMGFGAWIGGSIGDRLGRRNALAGAALAASQADTIAAMAGYRLLGGLVFGAAFPNSLARVRRARLLQRPSFARAVDEARRFRHYFPPVAAGNAGEKAKTMKRIVRDCLNGANGRPKVEDWVPRWMAFPPGAYTERGGVGTVAAHARAEAARGSDRPGGDEPDPAAPAAVLAPPDLDEAAEPAALAA